jgi:hypothetical protein
MKRSIEDLRDDTKFGFKPKGDFNLREMMQRIRGMGYTEYEIMRAFYDE